MRRYRIWMFVCAVMFASTAVAQQLSPSAQEWAAFKRNHIVADGRVIDNGNGGVSHTEGQGAGMLLAAIHDDRQQFQRIWSWTQSHLQIRDDHLFAWRWIPNATPNVDDHNNASDGDILIAWALYLGYERWGDDAYRTAADAITSDIQNTLLRRCDYGLVLLPGAEGFEAEDGIIINLSYWLFPAFALFERYSPSPQWNELRTTGLTLLKEARFGQWQLSPDWLHIKGKELTVVSQPYQPRFGYDAVRIPLYLVWAGLDSDPLLQPYQHFWQTHAQQGLTPAWVDLYTGTTGEYEASEGFHAIINLTEDRAQHISKPRMHEVVRYEDYYSSLLGAFAAVAREEGVMKAMPLTSPLVAGVVSEEK